MSNDADNQNVPKAMPAFDVLEAGDAAVMFERLHERVVVNRGRIEITRRGSGESCVLISKAELDSLEQAIAMLSNTDSGVAMRDELLRVAAQLGDVREPAAM